MLVEARSAEQEKKWRRIVEIYRHGEADYDIQTAISLDDLERVKAILAASPDLADREGSPRQTPLRTAASLGRFEVCRYLIANFPVDDAAAAAQVAGGVGEEELLARARTKGLLRDQAPDR